MGNFYSITGVQGSTLLLSLNLTDQTGAYIDLTSFGVKGYVKNSFASTGYLLNLHPQVTSAPSGQILISGNSVELAAIPVGVYNYNIEVYNSGDYVFKPLVGHIEIFPEIVTF